MKLDSRSRLEKNRKKTVKDWLQSWAKHLPNIEKNQGLEFNFCREGCQKTPCPTMGGPGESRGELSSPHSPPEGVTKGFNHGNI